MKHSSLETGILGITVGILTPGKCKIKKFGFHFQANGSW